MGKSRRTIKPSARVGTISRAKARKVVASVNAKKKPSGTTMPPASHAKK